MIPTPPSLLYTPAVVVFWSAATNYWKHTLDLVLLGVFASLLLSSCAETAECDRNIKCDDGQLCFRSFCKRTCTLEDGADDRQGDCPNRRICRPCSGLCAGDDGMVCVVPSVCEPSCQDFETCVDAECVAEVQ